MSIAVSFFLGIISTKVVSVFLGTPGMALLGSFRNFSAMLKSFATVGITNSLIKLFVENKEDKTELSAIYATFFWIFLLLSTCLGIIVFVFSEYIAGFLFGASSFNLAVQILALMLPLIVLNTFWLAIYNGLEFFKKIIIIQIIANTGVFAITMSFIFYSRNIHGALVAMAVSEVVMVIVTYLFIRKNPEHFRFKLNRVISKKYLTVIRNFSAMALLSALVAPMALILIRNFILETRSVNDAGIWEGVNRLSGFYMVLFNSGLSLYYMPKLASLTTQSEFKAEVKTYFKTLVPLFVVMLIAVFLFRDLIVDIAFTSEFNPVKDLLVWQMAGDLLRIMSLAFGFQIVVKTMMKEYFIIETAYNLIYLLMSFYLIKMVSVEGAVQAYFFANSCCFAMLIIVFRKVVFSKLYKKDHHR